jgi:hypothetical protein
MLCLSMPCLFMPCLVMLYLSPPCNAFPCISLSVVSLTRWGQFSSNTLRIYCLLVAHYFVKHLECLLKVLHLNCFSGWSNIQWMFLRFLRKSEGCGFTSLYLQLRGCYKYKVIVVLIAARLIESFCQTIGRYWL